MDLKTCSDFELLQIMLPDEDMSIDQLDAAWTEFFDRSNQFLLKYIHKLTRFGGYNRFLTEDDYQDLVQQVYIKILDNDYAALRTLKKLNSDSLKPFLATVAINYLKDLHRYVAANRRISQLCSLEEPHFSDSHKFAEWFLSTDTTPEVELMNKEFIHQLFELVGETTPEHRERNLEIFRRHYVEGLTLEEIAAQSDVKLTKGGISSFFNKVLPKLKAFLLTNNYERVLTSILLFFLLSDIT